MQASRVENAIKIERLGVIADCLFLSETMNFSSA